ncbi:NAD-dependent epimerase/dehydratase family protein [Histidinibacterium aquaticum]|uniref:NAD-dependent epimerase/dehydratase family protein n=1 Tax=Histidinibacterium aquaticum TaxID=2613962 RepID=UPI00168AB073|nr:NAD(P)-dependent oxidoreductase [Histidinibacterium aquaticum]
MILVTGATGFLGGRVVRELHRQGREVCAVGRAARPLARLKQEGIPVMRADLSAGIPGDLVPTAIIHCAGLSDPYGPASAFETANVATTRVLLDLARRSGAERFVFVSTPAVYWRAADQVAVREDTRLPQAVNRYAETKRRAEALVLSARYLSPVVLRPRAIYGRGERTLLPRLERAARRGPLPLMRGGWAVTDLTHVDDAVAACIAALDAKELQGSPVFNISGGTPLSVREVIERVCERRRLPLRWRPMPVPFAMAAARVLTGLSALGGYRSEPRATRYSVGALAYSQTLDITRAADRLGWRPKIGFEDGLDEALGA